MNDDADGHRFAVRVQKAAAAEPAGAVTDHRVRDALIAGEVEPLLDHLPGQRDHRLDAERQVVRRFLAPDAGVAAEEAVDPVGGDDDVRAELVLAGADADDALAFGEERLDEHAGHDRGAGLFALFSEPCVEPSPQHGDRVRRIREALVPVVDGHLGLGVEEAQAVACDDPFNRRLADEVRPDLLHYAAVEDAAGQVLGARLRSPLDDENLVPRPRQLIGRHAAGDPGPNDDHVEIDGGSAFGRCHRESLAERSPGVEWAPPPPSARVRPGRPP